MTNPDTKDPLGRAHAALDVMPCDHAICWSRPIPTRAMLARLLELRRAPETEDPCSREAAEYRKLLSELITTTSTLLERYEDLLGYTDGTSKMIPGEGLLPVKVAKLLARVEELERVAPVAELTFHGPIGAEELEGLRKALASGAPAPAVPGLVPERMMPELCGEEPMIRFGAAELATYRKLVGEAVTIEQSTAPLPDGGEHE